MFLADIDQNGNIIECPGIKYIVADNEDARTFAQRIVSLNPDTAVAASFWVTPFDWLGLSDALVAEYLEQAGIRTICNKQFLYTAFNICTQGTLYCRTRASRNPHECLQGIYFFRTGQVELPGCNQRHIGAQLLRHGSCKKFQSGARFSLFKKLQLRQNCSGIYRRHKFWHRNLRKKRRL